MKTILSISCKMLSINTLIVVLSLVIYSIGVNATVRYVKPIASGSADGSSWANASGDIQTMINASAAGDSVWVAAGTYKPNSYPPGCLGCVNSRDYTFYVKDGVRLFGNFTGTETDISQRDFSTNTTILSGDYNNNDQLISNFPTLTIISNLENAYHVLFIADISSGNIPVTIDGFTIKGGNANIITGSSINGMPASTNYGGGIFVQNQMTAITNCMFVNNSAETGGAIYSKAQNVTVNNNIFTNNVASFRGGGIAIINFSSTISNNSFIENFGSQGAGAIVSSNAESQIINNEINGNTTEWYGGGIYLLGSPAIVSNNTIVNNHGIESGGAIFIQNGAHYIENNIIAHNTVGFSGAGIFIDAGTHWITNNVIHNNNSEILGGGIYIDNTNNVITNNTITENNADNTGGGVYVNNGTNAFKNNIFWNNRLDGESSVLRADLFLNAGTNTFQNNMLQLDSTLYTGAYYSLGATAQGNLFAQNPLFLSNVLPEGEDLIYFTGDDGFRLQTISPALNAGIPTTESITDVLGITRDDQPDIGAYEHGVAVGIQPNTDSQPAASLYAYPNPATDAITFTFTTHITNESTLILYSIDGKSRISLYKGTTQAGETNTLTVDTKGFASGTYCAVLQCGNGLAEHFTLIIKH
jgi:predicted outer membrane repeat protein